MQDLTGISAAKGLCLVIFGADATRVKSNRLGLWRVEGVCVYGCFRVTGTRAGCMSDVPLHRGSLSRPGL